MGLLAGNKSRTKISKDPNNTKWARDTNTFGQKILRASGWEPGQFLGAQDASHAEFHTAASASFIKVSLKDDVKGLGFDRAKEDEITGLDVFSDLLNRLNGRSEEAIEEDRKARMQFKTHRYVEQKYGPMRFVRGGLLVGDELKVTNDESENLESTDGEGQDQTVEVSKPKKSKKRKERDEDDEATESSGKDAASKEKKRRKEDRKRSKSKPAEEVTDSSGEEVTKSKKKEKKFKKKKTSSSSTDVDDDTSDSAERTKKSKKSKSKAKHRDEQEEVSSPDAEEITDPKELKRLKKEKKKEKKQRKAEEAAATAVASASQTASDTPTVQPTPATSRSGTSTTLTRNYSRSRFIAQKKQAVLDTKALNQIFMVKA